MSVIVDHVKTPPVPPSEATELPIPGDLEAVIMRALSKAPADRFATAEEFSDALADCADCGKWTGRRGAEWWKLHLPQLAA